MGTRLDVYHPYVYHCCPSVYMFSQVKVAEEEVIPSKPAKPTTRYVGDEQA